MPTNIIDDYLNDKSRVTIEAEKAAKSNLNLNKSPILRFFEGFYRFAIKLALLYADQINDKLFGIFKRISRS